LFILNKFDEQASELFTDSVIGCVQVVARNPTVTFTTHLFSGLGAERIARNGAAAIRIFRREYGDPTFVGVFTTDAGQVAAQLTMVEIKKDFIRLSKMDGCAFREDFVQGGVTVDVTPNYFDGQHHVRPTPGRYNPEQPWVGGLQTKPDLIDKAYELEGRMVGDFSHQCELCSLPQ
jgi:hypothetical protein